MISRRRSAHHSKITMSKSKKLKQEMNDATHGADNIRNDIGALAQRYVVIKRNEECGVPLAVFSSHGNNRADTNFSFVCVCRKKILDASSDYWMARAYTSVGSMAPFYVFPCGHSFHSHCLIAHVTKCTTETQVSSGIWSLLLLYLVFNKYRCFKGLCGV
ncbi:vacuolar sorting protein 18-like [Primulina tabacum]|uniref:vacuolar sorting protein 18-like n=1 Tax=Primulina tabacum TaxID=48773 RepID=UPI003F5AC045